MTERFEAYRNFSFDGLANEDSFLPTRWRIFEDFIAFSE